MFGATLVVFSLFAKINKMIYLLNILKLLLNTKAP